MIYYVTHVRLQPTATLTSATESVLAVYSIDAWDSTEAAQKVRESVRPVDTVEYLVTSKKRPFGFKGEVVNV